MAHVFTSVTVYTLSPDQTLIEWELHPDFKLSGSYSFSVQFSRSANPDAADEWVQVGTQVVSPSATFSVYDADVRFASTTARTGFYRVELVNGDGLTYYSYIEPTWGGLGRADRLLIREMYRQECLRLRKKVGTSGFLYHSRQHGPKAALDNRSAEYVAGGPLGFSNSATINTRFAGGYWSPVPYVVEVSTPVNKTAKTNGPGNVAPVVLQGRALAFPVPMSGDIWHSCVTGRRYYVNDVRVVAAVRSVPVVMQFGLGEIPPGRVEYDLELP